MMIIYIHEHFRDKITVGNIAGAAFISERECFRTFQECLRTTPVEYLKAYRLQQASRMLAQGRESVTLVSQACGLGSSSYFRKGIQRAYRIFTIGIQAPIRPGE